MLLSDKPTNDIRKVGKMNWLLRMRHNQAAVTDNRARNVSQRLSF